jgi:AP-1-like transcription factor
MVLYPSADELSQRQQPDIAADPTFQPLSGQSFDTSSPEQRWLSQNQQDLLLAALNSQAAGVSNAEEQDQNSAIRKRTISDPADDMNSVGGDGLFMSPREAEFDQFNADYTPDLDYLDGDGFDFDNADLGGDMIGALPGEQHEKRKIADEDNDNEEGDAKRQETQEGEKGQKKPGRKPLTSEPTTVSIVTSAHPKRVFNIPRRSEKHRTELRNAHSGSGKRSISRI